MSCICGGNPGEYEGPLRDCPTHGDRARVERLEAAAARAILDLAELERSRCPGVRARAARARARLEAEVKSAQ